MKPDKSNWDMELLKQVFDDNFVKAIVNIPKWSCEDEDKWIWLKTSNGSLSVKSAYKELSTGGNMDHPNPLLGKIWKTHLHACHKMLLWRLAAGFLPTKDILRFATSLDPICIMCNDHAKSAVHLFCECPLARALWFGCKWGIWIDQISITSPNLLVSFLISPPDVLGVSKSKKDFFSFTRVLIVDQIWKLRNSKVHEGVMWLWRSWNVILLYWVMSFL